MKNRDLLPFLIPLVAISIPLLVYAISANSDGYQFVVLDAGDDIYVVCQNSHIQTDHIMPLPRPTPTNVPYPAPYPSPYPGPITQFQTSVYLRCHPGEVDLLDVRDKDYLPAVENE